MDIGAAPILHVLGGALDLGNQPHGAAAFPCGPARAVAGTPRAHARLGSVWFGVGPYSHYKSLLLVGAAICVRLGMLAPVAPFRSIHRRHGARGCYSNSDDGALDSAELHRLPSPGPNAHQLRSGVALGQFTVG